jgi:DNA-binding phage protein
MTATIAVPTHPLAKLRDFESRFEVLPLDQFFVDEDYQRPLTSLSGDIGALYLPPLVGTIIASERKVTRRTPALAIIDGQTRWAGAGTAGETEIPALIYSGLTKKDEALIFALLQMKRRNISTYQRYRAMVQAGDPEMKAIERLVNEQGFTLSPDEPSASVRAISALERTYRRSPDLLRETLWVIAQAWGTNDREAVSSDIVQGMATFIEAAEPDMDRLVARLRTVNPKILKFNAAAIRHGRSGGGGGYNRAMADAIRTEYLKKR